LPPLNERELSREDAAGALAQLHEAYVRQCAACRLAAQRKQAVFGVGHPRAELMFIGEGPGADEDAKGEPFVGRAGELLTKMIAAMTLTREQVYIANVVKCRPPGNRTPQEDEIAACSPYLLRQLAIIRPKWIVALGRPATQTLLTTTAPITSMRGKWHDFPPPALAGLSALPHCRVMPTFHPAYLLRSPQEKAKAWADLQEVMAVMGLKRG
jgi:uracil-DNA glycosylase family 4